jgi:hypothetical protein
VFICFHLWFPKIAARSRGVTLMDSPTPETKPAAGCAMGLMLLVAAAAYLAGIPLIAWGLKAALEQAPDRSSTAAALFGGFGLAWGVPRLWYACSPANLRVTWRDAVAAAPDLVLSGAFLVTWAHPSSIGEDSVKTMVPVLVLEFLVIHATIGLSATRARRHRSPHWRRGFWGLAAVYLLFASALSVGARSPWPALVIAGLTANKFLGTILAPREANMTPAQTREWAVQTALFIACGFAGGFLPVPALGVTESYGEGSGQWGEEPYRALASGALYYASLGFITLYGGLGTGGKAPDPSEAVVHAE